MTSLERYAVVSCHVEQPLDDDVWRRSSGFSTVGGGVHDHGIHPAAGSVGGRGRISLARAARRAAELAPLGPARTGEVNAGSTVERADATGRVVWTGCSNGLAPGTSRRWLARRRRCRRSPAWVVDCRCCVGSDISRRCGGPRLDGPRRGACWRHPAERAARDHSSACSREASRRCVARCTSATTGSSSIGGGSRARRRAPPLRLRRRDRPRRLARHAADAPLFDWPSARDQRFVTTETGTRRSERCPRTSSNQAVPVVRLAGEIAARGSRASRCSRRSTSWD